MKSPDQRGWNMAVLRMVIIAAAVQVCRHYGDKIGAMLQAISFAQFDGCDFGDRVPLIGRLKGAGEQRIFRHGLRREFRVDA
jgi:hypothetical protein